MEKIIAAFAEPYSIKVRFNELEHKLSMFLLDKPYEMPTKIGLESKNKYLTRALLNMHEQDTYDCIKYLINELPDYDQENFSTILETLEKKFPEYSEELPILNMEMVEDTKHWLNDFPEALKYYEMAEDQYTNKIYQRNLLDNLRFSLESLMKSLVKNRKSIENQDFKAILAALKSQGISVELRNMLGSLIGYFFIYQNGVVKHNDRVEEAEIEIIFEMTSSLMKFFIRELN